ncbi:MAG: hypothetical protein JXX28_02760 [Deltaproteobacteria bacterium]|nr:hypothetical protein [Deltaproteobacteria bacterium]
MNAIPSQLQTAAILQLVSGILNVIALWYVASMGLAVLGGAVTGCVTLGACPIGVACGIPPMALILVGVLEIVAGILTIARVSGTHRIPTYVAYLELASLLLGGLVSAIVGGVVLILMRSEEVRAYDEAMAAEAR